MKRAHIDSTLKYQRLMTGTFAVGKGADGLRAFVFIGNEEIV